LIANGKPFLHQSPLVRPDASASQFRVSRVEHHVSQAILITLAMLDR
jgi:hypothetical protein